MSNTKRVIEIAIPLPPAGLNAQQNGNRHVKTAATKAYKLEVLASVLSKRIQGFKTPVRIYHTWYCGLTGVEKSCRANKVQCPKKHRKYRPQDADNAIRSLKPAIDALRDAGVIVDDSHKWVQFGDFRRLGTAKENEGKHGIVLRIEEDQRDVWDQID